MRKWPAIFVISQLLLLPVLSFAQRTISGKVFNSETDEPLAGSSVFISNTSRGTVTTRDGYFELNNIPSGKYELIISSIGFETNVYSFTAEQLPVTLKIGLKQKIKEMENVSIEPSLEEGWDKWGRSFTEAFIGMTPNADRCVIKNTKALRFRFFRKSNRLVAYADEPIVVENRALGYRITFQLENFEMDFKKGSTAYAGYPLFEDMDKNRKSLRSRWQKGRDQAYYGSIMHFMQSLYRKRLDTAGFYVRRMVRIPNAEKERVKKLYRVKNVLRGSAGEVVRITSMPDTLMRDSTAYYRRILEQEDHIDIYGKDILTADSLIVDTSGDYKAIYFTDYLHITFRKEIEDKRYLEHFRESRSPSFQQSVVWLVNLKPVLVDPNGSYFPPEEFFSMGYWGWDEKIANLLPIDFEPEDE